MVPHIPDFHLEIQYVAGQSRDIRVFTFRLRQRRRNYVDKFVSISRKGAEFKAFSDVQMLSYNNSNEVSNGGSVSAHGENPKKRNQNVKMWIT